MTTLGTVQTKYSKKWIYLNPNLFDGPSAWNVANIPSQSGTPEIFGIPPMMISETSGAVDLSYSIIACKGLDELTRQLLVTDTPNIQSDVLTDIDYVITELPVNLNRFDNGTILYFDIESLDSVESTTAGTVEVAGYNSNSIASLTTSLPLEATQVGGVATVSFDITTLPDA